ncbi:MAG: hypothetical protein EP297_05460 [Gammaproteobacteria bacterium]|nr:MAG: hypothetical protein EP297_05460 [Gammaproteobacteria bacterium]
MPERQVKWRVGFCNGICGNSALYFRDQSVGDIKKRAMAKRMVDMLAELERQHLIHGDLKSTNFVIHKDEPVLVDLDAMDEVSNGLIRRRSFKRELDRF